MILIYRSNFTFKLAKMSWEQDEKARIFNMLLEKAERERKEREKNLPSNIPFRKIIVLILKIVFIGIIVIGCVEVGSFVSSQYFLSESADQFIAFGIMLLLGIIWRRLGRLIFIGWGLCFTLILVMSLMFNIPENVKVVSILTVASFAIAASFYIKEKKHLLVFLFCVIVLSFLALRLTGVIGTTTDGQNQFLSNNLSG